MRIRSIKPEFWRSDSIAQLSREERLLFIGLWSYVDDNGVGVDDYRLIAADLFPLDDDQSEVRTFVRESLDRLSRETLIVRYEVAGKRYIFISTWSLHQRVDNPNKPRFPRPDEEPDPPTSGNGQGRRPDARDSREMQMTLDTGTEEQGNSSKSSSRTPRDAEPPGFAEFYDAYPRKRERKKAANAYRSALKAGVAPERLLQAARSFAHANRGKSIEYIKYPASWLNAGAYEDEPEQPGLVLVSDAPPMTSFEDYRQHAAGPEAAKLLSKAYIPREQPPSDTTPARQWAAAVAVEWIDEHESLIRAALREQRNAG